jgi:hypothetical protein
MTKVRSNSFYDHLRVRALLGRREYGAAEQILRARSGDGNAWHFVWLACALDAQGRSGEAADAVATAKALATEKAFGSGRSNRDAAFCLSSRINHPCQLTLA